MWKLANKVYKDVCRCVQDLSFCLCLSLSSFQPCLSLCCRNTWHAGGTMTLKTMCQRGPKVGYTDGDNSGLVVLLQPAWLFSTLLHNSVWPWPACWDWHFLLLEVCRFLTELFSLLNSHYHYMVLPLFKNLYLGNTLLQLRRTLISPVQCSRLKDKIAIFKTNLAA